MAMKAGPAMLARLRRSAAAGIAAALLASVLTGPLLTSPLLAQTTAGPSMTDGRAAPEAATGRAASRGPVATRQMMVVAAIRLRSMPGARCWKTAAAPPMPQSPCS
jgi:hypothetical protein